jgi:eukaryotic-like serine/threonine-protein kinase
MINQTISHYRITGQLGSGGMGVVYEAEDLNLGRKVALKFLPPQLSGDQNALDRFLLEARSASALNHPNICTIYAVENGVTENGQKQSFIAMELLEGQSLEQKLYSGLLPLDRLLDFSIQLADALDAAHAKGIIHRDIKPGNIFVTQRGQIKILDFGLAKLIRPELQMTTLGATQDSPVPANLTNPGATVGTISYMSPEQSRGEELDTRTDLFSLGTVVYQMATGKLPFAGATSAVVFHAILELDPVPPAQVNPALPLKLQEIIEKLLEKDRDLRYQSAADLRGDLKRLKRDTESGRRPVRESGASVPAAPAQSSSGGFGAGAQSQPPKATSSPTFGGRRRLRRGRGNSTQWFFPLVLVLVLAVLFRGRIQAFFHHHNPIAFQNISVTKVTDTGNVVDVALSPDGKYILSIVRENGLASLSLRNVPTNSITQVEPPADVYYNGLQFSPDGNYLYFVRSDPGTSGDLKYLYRAPLLGGTPERLAEDVDSNVTFSPDGRKLAFLRYDNPEPGKYELILRPQDNSQETVLASGSNSQQLYYAAWSPDGKKIVCTELQPSADAYTGLVEIDVNTGQRKLLLGSPGVVASPTWMPDGSGLLVLFGSLTTGLNRYQIAFVSYPGGNITPVTRDTNTYSDLSVASTGQLLATVLSEGHWNLFVGPAAATGKDVRSIAPVSSTTNFTWTHDGRILFDKQTLFAINPQTGAQSPFLTESQGAGADPWECSDHQHIVFAFGLGVNSNQDIWRSDESGQNLKQLSNGRLDDYPVCSPDSRWVYYLDNATHLVMKVGIDGGSPQTVANARSEGFFDISPDGATVAFVTINHAAGHQERILLVATDTGETRKMLELQRPIMTKIIRFSRGGKSVIYTTRDRGVDNLWEQPLDGSAGRQITSFTSDRIWDYKWSEDGSQLAVSRGHTDSDVVLIRDQQQ